MPQFKQNNINVEYSDGFTGEVHFTKADGTAFGLPMDLLVRVVAEKIRADGISNLERAKPSDLIRRLA